MNPPPIPDQPELFCMACGKFWPRAFIVSARWLRNGPQVRYRCRGCQEAMERRTPSPPAPLPLAGEGSAKRGERADGG